MVSDMHMHIIPDVDDGAVDLNMSLEMLQIAYSQGVRNIFCTSHNVYSADEILMYRQNFASLQFVSKDLFDDLNLYMGNEILCEGDCIDDIICRLNTGHILSLNNSTYVLIEFYGDVESAEAERIVIAMITSKWIPVIAHVERYSFLFIPDIKHLVELGALVQVNLYSLQEEQNSDIKNRARALIDNKLVHFIGSDAHRINHRAPKYKTGVKYLNEHCDNEYYEDLYFRNAMNIVNEGTL